MLQRTLSALLVLAFGFTIIGCHASASIDKPESSSSSSMSSSSGTTYEKKTTTVQEPNGDVTKTTEMHRD